MTRVTQTFSESWHRVSDIRVALKTTVKIHKQNFRGEWWYILGDPFSNRFFRVKPHTYAFLVSLEQSRTVDQIWQSCLEHDPDQTPGQQEVINLLVQLHENGLLQYNSGTDSHSVFKRQQIRKRQELRSKLLGFMFIKIPLLDPDSALKKAGPYLNGLFTRGGLVFWLLTLLWAGKTAIDNAGSLVDQSQGLLAPSNLMLLYLAMALVKILHELGHAVVCRHYSGEVHTVGVMLILLIPLPYMDATSSWSFKRPWQRIFVGGAGMIVELWVAAVAVLIWANTGAGTLNSLAYNIIFVASVSTLLFNGNPLLRFDAYYMLSDALDIPNLFQRSRKQIVYLVERFIFGCQQLIPEAYSRKEAWILSIYALLSVTYRILILTGIILFIANKYLILGLIMALFSLVMWVIPPPFKLIHYLATNQRIARRRKEACRITAATILATTLALICLPAPHNIKVPGVIEAVNFSRINAQTSGFLQKILVQDNQFVTQGTPLMQLHNGDLERELEAARLLLTENRYLQEKARTQNSADLAPLLIKQQSLFKRLSKLEEDKNKLVLTAPFDGVWSAPDVQGHEGSWITKGTSLGVLYSQKDYRFAAVVQQNNGLVFHALDNLESRVRITGQERTELTVQTLEILPFDNEKLPSAALGWQGGGQVAVKSDDETGTRTVEPFFLVYAQLPDSEDVLYSHGRSGTLRISLSPEPLLWQWYRQLLQLLQKRFQV